MDRGGSARRAAGRGRERRALEGVLRWRRSWRVPQQEAQDRRVFVGTVRPHNEALWDLCNRRRSRIQEEAGRSGGRRSGALWGLCSRRPPHTPAHLAGRRLARSEAFALLCNRRRSCSPLGSSPDSDCQGIVGKRSSPGHRGIQRRSGYRDRSVQKDTLHPPCSRFGQRVLRNARKRYRNASRCDNRCPGRTARSRNVRLLCRKRSTGRCNRHQRRTLFGALRCSVCRPAR